MIYITVEVSVSDSALSWGKDVGKAQLELKLVDTAVWDMSLGNLPDELFRAALMDYEEKHIKEEEKEDGGAADEGTSE